MKIEKSLKYTLRDFWRACKERRGDYYTAYFKLLIETLKRRNGLMSRNDIQPENILINKSLEILYAYQKPDCCKKKLNWQLKKSYRSIHKYIVETRAILIKDFSWEINRFYRLSKKPSLNLQFCLVTIYQLYLDLLFFALLKKKEVKS